MFYVCVAQEKKSYLLLNARVYFAVNERFLLGTLNATALLKSIISDLPCVVLGAILSLPCCHSAAVTSHRCDCRCIPNQTVLRYSRSALRPRLFHRSPHPI